MKKIILDGYNIIHKIPKLELKMDESLESARRALAMLLSDWRRRYLDASVCIVFDGKDREAPDVSAKRIAGIDCVFTRTGESADTRIIRIVHDSKNAREILVISDDNSVRNSCCAHGAEVKPVSFLTASGKKKTKVPADSEKIIPPADFIRVKDYYEEHLRKKGKI